MQGLAQCQLGMQEHDACVDTCMEFFDAAAGEQPEAPGAMACLAGVAKYKPQNTTAHRPVPCPGDSPFLDLVRYNCGCALLALGDFGGAVHQLELAAATIAADDPIFEMVQEALQEAQQALQASLASREQPPALDAQPQAVAAVPPAACLKCRRGRLDGALLHGTT